MKSREIQRAIDELSSLWSASGVKEGDTVLIHSSLSRTLRRYKDAGIPLTPADAVESFLQAVGSQGTMVFPLWNFDFSRGVPFDIRNTPSQMGALTEAGRFHPQAVRTGHPIYNVAAIGKASREFRGLVNFSGYGEESPFALVHKMKGKVAVLDVVENDSVTFYHYVEEMLNVPYRFHKRFVGDYTDHNGFQSKREFGLFVRFKEPDFEVHITVDPMGELLWEKGLYQGDRPKSGSGLRVIPAETLYNETARVIEEGSAEGLLYTVTGKRPKHLAG